MTPTPEQNAKRVILKPCPFCGHKQTDADKHDHIVNHHDEGYAIHALACSKCGAVGPFGPEDDIEDAWNKRTPDPDELGQAADGMREEIEKAPHSAICNDDGVGHCTCWKSKALARYRALAGEGK